MGLILLSISRTVIRGLLFSSQCDFYCGPSMVYPSPSYVVEEWFFPIIIEMSASYVHLGSEVFPFFPFRMHAHSYWHPRTEGWLYFDGPLVSLQWSLFDGFSPFLYFLKDILSFDGPYDGPYSMVPSPEQHFLGSLHALLGHPTADNSSAMLCFDEGCKQTGPS